jgi:RHS repeat-associated protein
MDPTSRWSTTATATASRKVNGQTKSYLIDDRNPTGYAQVVEEIVNGSVNHTYTYGHDLISQDQVDPANNAWHATFYAYDGHGNVRFLTNESGQVTDTYVYDAFGTLITATGSTNNRYLYTGEQFGPNLGLYYLRARLMNPLTGRFGAWIITRDRTQIPRVYTSTSTLKLIRRTALIRVVTFHYWKRCRLSRSELSYLPPSIPELHLASTLA